MCVDNHGIGRLMIEEEYGPTKYLHPLNLGVFNYASQLPLLGHVTITCILTL